MLSYCSREIRGILCAHAACILLRVLKFLILLPGQCTVLCGSLSKKHQEQIYKGRDASTRKSDYERDFFTREPEIISYLLKRKRDNMQPYKRWNWKVTRSWPSTFSLDCLLEISVRVQTTPEGNGGCMTRDLYATANKSRYVGGFITRFAYLLDDLLYSPHLQDNGICPGYTLITRWEQTAVRIGR